MGRYGRYDNPNWIEVEDRLAKIDECETALIFPSGMSAITTTLMSLLKKGDNIIYTGKGYRNIRNFCGNILSEFGIKSYPLSPADSEKFITDLKKNYDKNTKVVFLEIPSNPHLHLVDIERVKEIVSEDTYLIVDSTFSSPSNFKPKCWGADLVIHSCGKYIGGHSDLMAGSVAGDDQLIEKIRNYRNVLGSIADPRAAYLFNRSIYTLEMRMKKLNESGMKLAEVLERHSGISKVYYSGLKSCGDTKLAKKYLSGHGGVVTFELDATENETSKFVDLLKIPYMGTHFGSCHSMVEQCSIFTYYKEPEGTRKGLGISDSLVRYSVGFEDNIEDIIDDITNTLQKI